MGKIPDLSTSFPKSVTDLKISSDLGNMSHGPHYDVIQGIFGGTDQIRISRDGNILGGTTNIGKTKMNW